MEQQIVDRLREIIIQIAPDSNERKMYGGLVYEVPDTKPKRQFVGLFKRQGYVTVELDLGAELDDPQGVLEGTGKRRRHIKLTDMSEIESKNVEDYLLRSLSQS